MNPTSLRKRSAKALSIEKCQRWKRAFLLLLTLVQCDVRGGEEAGKLMVKKCRRPTRWIYICDDAISYLKKAVKSSEGKKNPNAVN